MSVKELQGVYASYDTLTEEHAKELWDAGKRVYSQQLWTALEMPGACISNLRVALKQGFVLVGPIALNASHGGGWHVDQARIRVPSDLWEALALIPIDVELPGIDNSEIKNAVEASRAHGKRPSLYASTGTWGDQGNPGGFEDCLWYQAQYDNVPHLGNLVLPPGVTYGQVVGKQYTNTISDGFDHCNEVWDEEILVKKEEDMAIELIWCPMPDGSGRLYVLGQGDPRWITDATGAVDLEAAYGPPKRALSWSAMLSLGAK